MEIGIVFETEHILLNEWSMYAREHLVDLNTEKEVQEICGQAYSKNFLIGIGPITSTIEKWEVTAVSPTSKHHQEMLQIMATHTNTTC